MAQNQTKVKVLCVDGQVYFGYVKDLQKSSFFKVQWIELVMDGNEKIVQINLDFVISIVVIEND